MTITLSAEIEELVNERVRSGAYATAHEVLLTSLRLLKAQEEKRAELKRDIQIGLDAIQQGRYSTYTTDAELEDFASDVIRRAQERKAFSTHSR
ncbi:MAG: ribbon-helix-helix domain-containing protein [Blastocatellia bacterium]